MFSFAQTDDELKGSLKKHKIEWEDTLKMDCPGMYIRLKRNQPVIRLRDYPITVTDYGVLQHEIFHAVDQILKYIGITLSDDSDEAYAYLIEYVTREIYKKF